MAEEKDNIKKDKSLMALKGQRLARALYLVSSFIFDQDPLKWKIREGAIELLKESKNLSHLFLDKEDGGQVNLESNIVLNKLNGHIDQLVSLIDLAVTGGTISEMNFSVLKNELSILLENISQEIKSSNISQYIESGQDHDIKTVNGLPVSNHNQNSGSKNHSNQISHNGPHIGQVYVPRNNGHFISASNGQNITKNLLTVTPNAISKSLNSNKSDNRDTRKKTIIDFVSGRGWTSIKDIATAVRGCGEKTVQRLLVEMVEEGVLKKQGERRWSRYMLA
jgi:hypothetical protein